MSGYPTPDTEPRFKPPPRGLGETTPDSSSLKVPASTTPEGTPPSQDLLSDTPPSRTLLPAMDLDTPPSRNPRSTTPLDTPPSHNPLTRTSKRRSRGKKRPPASPSDDFEETNLPASSAPGITYTPATDPPPTPTVIEGPRTPPMPAKLRPEPPFADRLRPAHSDTASERSTPSPPLSEVSTLEDTPSRLAPGGVFKRPKPPRSVQGKDGSPSPLKKAERPKNDRERTWKKSFDDSASPGEGEEEEEVNETPAMNEEEQRAFTGLLPKLMSMSVAMPTKMPWKKALKVWAHKQLRITAIGDEFLYRFGYQMLCAYESEWSRREEASLKLTKLERQDRTKMKEFEQLEADKEIQLEQIAELKRQNADLRTKNATLENKLVLAQEKINDSQNNRGKNIEEEEEEQLKIAQLTEEVEASTKMNTALKIEMAHALRARARAEDAAKAAEIQAVTMKTLALQYGEMAATYEKGMGMVELADGLEAELLEHGTKLDASRQAELMYMDEIDSMREKNNELVAKIAALQAENENLEDHLDDEKAKLVICTRLLGEARKEPDLSLSTVAEISISPREAEPPSRIPDTRDNDSDAADPDGGPTLVNAPEPPPFQPSSKGKAPVQKTFQNKDSASNDPDGGPTLVDTPEPPPFQSSSKGEAPVQKTVLYGDYYIARHLAAAPERIRLRYEKAEQVIDKELAGASEAIRNEYKKTQQMIVFAEAQQEFILQQLDGIPDTKDNDSASNDPDGGPTLVDTPEPPPFQPSSKGKAPVQNTSKYSEWVAAQLAAAPEDIRLKYEKAQQFIDKELAGASEAVRSRYKKAQEAIAMAEAHQVSMLKQLDGISTDHDDLRTALTDLRKDRQPPQDRRKAAEPERPKRGILCPGDTMQQNLNPDSRPDFNTSDWTHEGNLEEYGFPPQYPPMPIPSSATNPSPPNAAPPRAPSAPAESSNAAGKRPVLSDSITGPAHPPPADPSTYLPAGHISREDFIRLSKELATRPDAGVAQRELHKRMDGQWGEPAAPAPRQNQDPPPAKQHPLDPSASASGPNAALPADPSTYLPPGLISLEDVHRLRRELSLRPDAPVALLALAQRTGKQFAEYIALRELYEREEYERTGQWGAPYPFLPPQSIGPVPAKHHPPGPSAPTAGPDAPPPADPATYTPLWPLSHEAVERHLKELSKWPDADVALGELYKRTVEEWGAPGAPAPHKNKDPVRGPRPGPAAPPMGLKPHPLTHIFVHPMDPPFRMLLPDGKSRVYFPDGTFTVQHERWACPTGINAGGWPGESSAEEAIRAVERVWEISAALSDTDGSEYGDVNDAGRAPKRDGGPLPDGVNKRSKGEKSRARSRGRRRDGGMNFDGAGSVVGETAERAWGTVDGVDGWTGLDGNDSVKSAKRGRSSKPKTRTRSRSVGPSVRALSPESGQARVVKFLESFRRSRSADSSSASGKDWGRKRRDIPENVFIRPDIRYAQHRATHICLPKPNEYVLASIAVFLISCLFWFVEGLVNRERGWTVRPGVLGYGWMEDDGYWARRIGELGRAAGRVRWLVGPAGRGRWIGV
ncbi:hypothetical protein EJ06DRAFT_558395 [Trichodelitschia bisporula]|uniref:Uncharacterized protein n=1 Tax=Trichodelitschia bisporula TaxID=703511 RepID=A0A6G1HQE0_9PEZI|nr:hypothetical protein EJ06DRAFT_558395 [Trichodelitschia bisporula]